MNEVLLHVTNATQAYNMGQLDSAKVSATKALALLENTNLASDSNFAFAYLNALTLLQSIATRQHDTLAYEYYEPAVKESILSQLDDFAHSYYAVHLLDACECYLNAGDIANAQWRLEDAVSILRQENGNCLLIVFLHACYNAKLHFHMEQYYECIADCITANNAWTERSMIPEDATAFLQQFIQNDTLVNNLGISNLILAGCAFGKINNPKEGLKVLAELSKQPPEDYYLRTSLDMILTELYIRARKLSDAQAIYQKYRNINLDQYADLRASLAMLSLVLEQDFDTAPDFFAMKYDGQLASTNCYSRDAFQIMLYNYGLAQIGKGLYPQALKTFEQLGNRGISLKLFLLAKMNNYAAIPECKKTADEYYEREIRSLFLYYNEKLVYNHLSLLEYHFSFCMDAYLSCYENLGKQVMPAEDIYDFLLNTKYISAEAAYLSNRYQTLDALNQRTPITGKEIQQRLSEESLLLEYCLTRTPTESHYCVFLISRDEIHAIRLCDKQTLDALLTQWQALMLRSAFASSMEELQLNHELQEVDTKLRRLLYRPIRDWLSARPSKHLLICPAGALIQFPFSRLPMSATAYLGDCYEITYLNTAKELLMDKTSRTPDWDSTLIIGDPALTDYPPLPYARMEAVKTAEYLQASCYIGEDAVIDLFEPCLQGAPSLIHIATHGVFQEVSTALDTPDWNSAYAAMENSGLLLAGNKLLSCNLISVMDFSNTSLVVLSACQTGQGIFHAAEGIYGLRRAFRLAGCHAMIVSLWQIDDRSGNYFMDYFYCEFTSGCTARDAFFQAIHALRTYEENGSQPFAHPYYWAGYLFVE